MSDKLLITLKSQDLTRTFSFDGAAQTALWVGFAKKVGPDNALLRMEGEDGCYSLRAVNGGAVKCAGHEGESVDVPVGSGCVATLTRAGEKPVYAFVRPVVAGLGRYTRLVLSEDADITIGRNRTSNLLYDSAFVSARHARISYSQGTFAIVDLDSSNGTFLNGKPLNARQTYLLKPGDVVQVLELILAVGKRFLSINTPPQLTINVQGASYLTREIIHKKWPNPQLLEGELPVFYPAPRLTKSIHPLELQVDDPPSKKEPDKQPVLMAIGPSFLMGMASIFMVASSISRLAEGQELLSVMPTIAMGIAMIGGSVIWPIISRSYNQKKEVREEALRSNMYVAYLDHIETRLANEVEVQSQILRENRRPVSELLERAHSQSPLLMSHANVQGDFMDLRVGVGDMELESNVTWPQRHFTLSEDRMIDRVAKLSKNPPMLRDVPIAFNPSKHFIAGILGTKNDRWSFLRGLLVQTCALYSYQDVKILMVSSEEDRSEWDFLESLGHLYSDGGRHRLVALSQSGMVEEDLLIERELANRTEQQAEVLADYGTYYLVICANHALAERSEGIRRLMQIRSNRGFSLIYLGETLHDLPRECSYIIDLGHDGGSGLGISLDMQRDGDRQRQRAARMFERADVSGSLMQFDPDIMVGREKATSFARSLARAHLDLPETRKSIPEAVGFLEMFEVGNAAHLNIGQRWVESDASQTLETPIGIDEQGSKALLNLHESIHGPHGLIAGTTGSGKSELIITYVLSMCVNYAPDEVAFVLIDYKGGGLAGAFDNERHYLPHLAGTITNLDGAAIHRSLVSIQSELRRRQDIFNHARDITGESTMDIYKYLSFYRQGVLTEPLPHLFIVADEFAELKQQEPEFMDELISAARIGRSLGVHLILATQKPSGVVNDQIWSNSRFKLCLKVSDASDSREMIKRPDAAEITQAGRYYLLVGYNESFIGGQAAYAGGVYKPVSTFEPKHDYAVELLDEEGNAVARMRPPSEMPLMNLGSEVEAVLERLEAAAQVSGKQARRLWLDPLPNHITLSALDAKYGAVKDDSYVVVVGEVDNPEQQQQFRYEVNLAETGNVLLYGSQTSGVDGLLQTMLFSMAKTCGPQKLWFYAVDFGVGALASLESLPQCGGVVQPGDDERIENLIRMLEEQRRERQRLFSASGGSMEAYNEHAEQPLSRIVVAIEGIAALIELYPSLEDTIVSLTREGPRYGIHFMITAATANSVRMRMSANFATAIPTMLNDSNDYLSIMGSMHGMTPPHQERRGLVKVGKQLLEFQGASMCEPHENPLAIVESLAREIEASSDARAPEIPQLPERVHVSDMGIAATAHRLPVGYAKRGIAPVYFDVQKSPYFLVLGNENGPIDRYLRGLREALSQAPGVSYRFIDMQQLLANVAADKNVLVSLAEVEAFMAGLVAGELSCDVVVFTSITQTMASLSPAMAQKLQDYLCEERGLGKTSFVCASELWRVRTVYDAWYKVITAYGNGLWVGSGFADQAVFHFARALPEYRQPAGRSDAFLTVRGDVTWVRLLESVDESIEDE